ncbi:hypothetical protein IU501_35355 [Nocardia otitidiscaviarum]|uniref:hypothetical protein n=1 Tax=Nocardia otitidiscaviarum TaxID=1823 RepID=UPI001893DEC8|nr:hypothetical protein [Nocardia otitidiscaviarum]MBF6138252.1 hypothetical protein [Nocardia otitidiscaviarum]
MNAVNREPAIRRRTPPHPADTIPERPGTATASTPPEPAAAPTPPPPAPAAPPLEERLIEQHNVRIRPSTKTRLGRAVDKLRYETGDRSISIASITDEALREYMDRRGC